MSWLQDQVNSAINRARIRGAIPPGVEISSSAPNWLSETVSAFANTNGGLIILGVDEDANFAAAGVDTQPLIAALKYTCSVAVEPDIRAEIEVSQVDGTPVAAAFIPPLAATRRPCFIRSQGMERGSYVRTQYDDRHLSAFEIHALLSERGQPKNDIMPVADTTQADLDKDLVTSLIARLRQTRGSILENHDDASVLRAAGVITSDGQLTRAGLIGLGRYPQQFLPQLNINFVCYAMADASPMPDGTRFLDNQVIDGPAPMLMIKAEAALTRNADKRYPLPAFREIVANAIIHRDYHPLAQGTPIRIELYPDRLVVTNPGGFYGAVDTETLARTPFSSSRNATLSRLLEDVEMPNEARPIAENRGAGLMSVAAELKRAGLPPAHISATLTNFVIELLGVHTHANKASHDPTMLTERQTEVLAILRSGPASAADLATSFGVSRQAILKHLGALEQYGLCEPTKKRRSKQVKWQAV